MASITFLSLPKEILTQILEYIDNSELCQPALACGLLNTLCEKQIYQNVCVIKYAYSHVGETRYNAIYGFFNAIKRRPERLSYIRAIDARLELRMDSGLHHACQLFVALPKMSCLNDLRLEIVGGIKPHREHRSLEQSMIWGCTFERARMRLYQFFRKCADVDEHRGLHAIKNLRSLKVLFPSNSIGLQTDLMAYSALQHNSVTRLELKHISNASITPPKLSATSRDITYLSIVGCQLPPIAYQSILASISGLEYFEYSPATPTGVLPAGGLVKALAHHRDSLRSLSIKSRADEMQGLDLSAFSSVISLEFQNPAWNEDAMDIRRDETLGDMPVPASFPPFLEVFTLKNFHRSSFSLLVEWLDTKSALLEFGALPHLKMLCLKAESLGDEYTFDNFPMYMTTASAFHIDGKILSIGMKYLQKLKVKLCVNDSLLFGEDASTAGPFEIGPKSMVMKLQWACRPRFAGSEDVVSCATANMSPGGAIERLLLLKGNNLNGQLSWQDL